MRRIAVGAVLGAVFAVGLIVTLPVDALVRVALGRLPPAAAATVEHVGSARLGWRGLVATDVRLRVAPGAPPLALESVALRPSLLGLAAGRWGRPWQVWVDGCDGSAAGTLDERGDNDAITIRFEAIDLAPCLAPFEPRGPVSGRATGDAVLVRTPDGVRGNGVLTLRDAHWAAEGIPRHVPLRATEATLRWHLDGAIRVDDFTLLNDELVATGSGVIEAVPAGSSRTIALRIHIEPTAQMPQAHRDLLNRLPGSPPDANGGRSYAIGGSFDAPQLGMP